MQVNFVTITRPAAFSLLGIALGLLGGAPKAQAQFIVYQYRPVATGSPNNFIKFVGVPAINGSGAMAFKEAAPTVEKEFIVRSTALFSTVIATADHNANGTNFFIFGGTAAINDLDEVAFWAGFADGTAKELLFTAGQFALRGSGISNVLSEPSVNNSGTVAFSFSDQTIFAAHPNLNPVNTISTSGNFASLGAPFLNNAGTLLFNVVLDNGARAITTFDFQTGPKEIVNSSGPLSTFPIAP